MVKLAEEGTVTETIGEGWFTKFANKTIKYRIYFVDGAPRMAVRSTGRVLVEFKTAEDFADFKDGHWRFMT